MWFEQGLSQCVHQKFLRFSLYAVLVCKARRPADFDDRPTCATPFPMCSSCWNRTSPCLMSLRSQNLCWFSQQLRSSQRWAMSAGNDACSLRDFTFLYCGAQVLSVPPPVWSRSTVPSRPYRLSAVVDGGRLPKLHSGSIFWYQRAREVHGRSLRHTTFQQFRVLMTKVNCLTSSDRKINIVVIPEQHECDVDIRKKLYANAVSSATRPCSARIVRA